MRERVSLSGGEFSAEPQPGRGFRVAARFPLPATAQAGAANSWPGPRPAEARPAEVLATRALPGQAR